MIDNLQYTLPLLISILKVFTIWYNKEALSPLIDMIIEDWMKTKMKEERNVMLKQAKIVRLVTVCGVFMILGLVTIVFSAFFYGQMINYTTNLTDLIGKPLPIPTYYLYDISSSPKYEITYLIQLIGLIACGLYYTAIDNLLVFLVLHICGQIENLHLRLLNLRAESNFKVILKHNVKDHIRLIRSTEIVDDTFNLMILGLLFLFGILFCLHGFLIINVIKIQSDSLSTVNCIWYISSSVCVLMHTGIYCAGGEFLVTQSEKIFYAAYEYSWYNLEPKVAKELILIMLRAKKPLNITAGKTFPMTMSTFCNLLKTSAGYVSVLFANNN
ncbi:hypothetical protein PUN28_018699 [Cardiocondyla obscurior]